MNEEKKQLRAWVRARKKEHTPEECAQRSAQLWEQLEQSPRFQQAESILLYYSLKDEVQTQAFVERWYTKKEIWLPVVVGDELELRLYTGKESLRVGAYGIEEPIGQLLKEPERIQLGLIPGMSFDKEGHRLGRGKGYYDRLLPHLQSFNIGICYQYQVAEKVPCEPFDRSMNAVLTDEGWLLQED